jgi:hypothetical protein
MITTMRISTRVKPRELRFMLKLQKMALDDTHCFSNSSGCLMA